MQCEVKGCDQDEQVEMTIVLEGPTGDDDQQVIRETRNVCLDCLDGLTSISGLRGVTAEVETID